MRFLAGAKEWFKVHGRGAISLDHHCTRKPPERPSGEARPYSPLNIPPTRMQVASEWFLAARIRAKLSLAPRVYRDKWGQTLLWDHTGKIPCQGKIFVTREPIP